MTNLQQQKDGSWKPAIPLPYYGVRKRCQCGKKFWREENYEKHYIVDHLYRGEALRKPIE